MVWGWFIALLKALYRDNGKENGRGSMGVVWGYIGIIFLRHTYASGGEVPRHDLQSMSIMLLAVWLPIGSVWALRG